MVAFNLIWAVIVVFITVLVPGVLIAFPFLKRTKTSFLETVFYGIILGVVVPPMIVFLLSFFGVAFSFGVVLGSIVLVSVIGILWNLKEKSFPTKFEVDTKNLKPLAGPLLLIFIFLISFYVRLQSLSPNYYEFDPYFYQYTTKLVLTQGHVPVIDNSAWYPLPYTHRGVMPLMNYLVSEWYVLTFGSLSYDNFALAQLSAIYPPLFGALLAFVVYALVKEEYGEWFGLLAAGFTGFMPIVVEKFTAGVMDVAPWGIFSSFFLTTSLGIAVNRGSREYAALAGLAILAGGTGSAYINVIMLIYIAYIGLITTIAFLAQRNYEETSLWNFRFLHNSKLRQLLEIDLIVSAFVVFTYILDIAFRGPAYLTIYGTYSYVASYMLLTVCLTAYVMMLYFAQPISSFFSAFLGSSRKEGAWDSEIRAVYIGLIVLAGALAIFAIPSLQSSVYDALNSVFYFSTTQSTVLATVAEESLIGFNDLMAQLQNSAGGLGSLIAAVLQAIFGILGLPQNSVLVYFFLVTPFVAGIVYSVYKGSRIPLIIGIITLPIAYIGVHKIKYVLHLSLALGIIFPVTLAMLERALLSLGDKKTGFLRVRSDLNVSYTNYRTLAKVPLVFCAVVLLFHFYPFQSVLGFSSYPNVGDVVVSSLSPELRVNGLVDCNKLYQETGGNNARALSIAQYCTKIPDAWMNVMNWINTSTEQNARVLSWWDYGHWTNFFGNRNTVTRGEHPYEIMDQEVANAFTNSPPEKLAAYMRTRDSRYVMFDWELIFGGGGDGKWGALNFLSCAYNNQTNVSQPLGNSACEAEHRMEFVYVPLKPDLTDYCTVGNTTLVKAYSTFNYVYCLQQVQNSYVMYYQNNLTQNTGLLSYINSFTGANGKQYATFIVLYHPSYGFDNRKGKFYDSSFYDGFFLGNMTGFVQVYPANQTGFRLDVPVRVYKLLPLLNLKDEKGIVAETDTYNVEGNTEGGMTVKVNGDGVELGNSYSFSKTVSLAPGENDIKVEATDNQGYTTIKILVVDFNVPFISGIGGSTFPSNSNSSINGTTPDNGTKVSKVTGNSIVGMANQTNASG